MHEQRRHIPVALARPGRCKLAGQRRCSALCGTDACCRSRPAGSAACYWHACASSWAPARVRERSPNATRTRLDDERQEGQPRAGERGVARQQVARGQQRPRVQLVGEVEVGHRARGGHAARHHARVAPAHARPVRMPKSALSFLVLSQLMARRRMVARKSKRRQPSRLCCRAPPPWRQARPAALPGNTVPGPTPGTEPVRWPSWHKHFDMSWLAGYGRPVQSQCPACASRPARPAPARASAEWSRPRRRRRAARSAAALEAAAARRRPQARHAP